MSKVVLLDAGPLGMITHPRKNPEVKIWLQQLLQRGIAVMIPEIADYEVRRELLRAGKKKGVERLDALKIAIGYIPLTLSSNSHFGIPYFSMCYARLRGLTKAGGQSW